MFRTMRPYYGQSCEKKRKKMGFDKEVREERERRERRERERKRKRKR